MPVWLKHKISVNVEQIGLYSSENLANGPVVILRYFYEGKKTQFFSLLIPPKKNKLNQTNLWSGLDLQLIFKIVKG